MAEKNNNWALTILSIFILAFLFQACQKNKPLNQDEIDNTINLAYAAGILKLTDMTLEFVAEIENLNQAPETPIWNGYYQQYLQSKEKIDSLRFDLQLNSPDSIVTDYKTKMFRYCDLRISILKDKFYLFLSNETYDIKGMSHYTSEIKRKGDELSKLKSKLNTSKIRIKEKYQL